HADGPVVRREAVKVAALEQCHEKADRPDPARESEREAHREGYGADGGHAHDHVTALDQRRPRDDGHGEEKTEFRRRGRAETAPPTWRWNATPMTPAGTVASTSSPAVRSSAGRRASTPRAIAHRRAPYTTSTEPRVATWSATSTKTPGVCTPVATSSTRKCPELETGRNSVSPCTNPSTIPCHSVIRPAPRPAPRFPRAPRAGRTARSRSMRRHSGPVPAAPGRAVRRPPRGRPRSRPCAGPRARAAASAGPARHPRPGRPSLSRSRAPGAATRPASTARGPPRADPPRWPRTGAAAPRPAPPPHFRGGRGA